MQDIYIDKVLLTNVRCHETGEMDFPVDNFTVIGGKNGAGKSTYFKSVSMALYGDDGGKKGERLSLTDMVNCKNEKDLSIILFFRVVEGERTDNYEIRLYQNHSKFRNSMFLYLNGTDISGETKTETYKMIEGILVPRDVYHNTVYFSQQVKDFFTSLTNSEQKDIFDSIMSMKIYDKYYRNSDVACNNVLGLIASIDRDISIIFGSINEKLASKVEMENQRESLKRQFQEKITNLKARKIELENKLQILDTEISEYSFSQEEYDGIVRELTVIGAKLESIYHSANEKIEAQKEAKLSKIREIDAEFARRKAQQLENIETQTSESIRVLQERLDTIQQRLNEISKRFDTTALENDRIGFEREKQREINEVNKMILKIPDDLPTDEIQSRWDNRSRFFDENTSGCKSLAEDIKRRAKLAKESMDSLQAMIDADEHSISGPTPICIKCKRPFSEGESVTSIRESIDANKLRIKNYTEEIEKFKHDIVKAKEDYDSFTSQKEKEKKEYQESIDVIIGKRNQRKAELERKLEFLKAEIEEFTTINKAKIKEIIDQRDLNSINLIEEQKEVSGQIARLRIQKSSKRSSVEEVLTKEHQNKTSEHINTYDDNILAIRTESESARKKLLLTQRELEQKKTDLDIVKYHLTGKKFSRDGYVHELSSLTSSIANEKEYQFDETRIVKLDAEIDDLKIQMTELNAKKKKLERDLTILTFWKSAFSDTGIKSMLIDVAIPHMNEKVAEYLEIIASGVFTVSFDTVKATKSEKYKDKFSVNIRHNVKGTDSHKKLSGGEKRLVDIACMFALRSLTEKLYGKCFHNVFYDEVLDSLDEDSAAVFCQASKVLSQGKNVTLITHNISEFIEPDRKFQL